MGESSFQWFFSVVQVRTNLGSRYEATRAGEDRRSTERMTPPMVMMHREMD
jgi:hypothetical protein